MVQRVRMPYAPTPEAPRFKHHVTARLSPTLAERVRRVAAARDERLSEFLRTALRERLERVEREETR